MRPLTIALAALVFAVPSRAPLPVPPASEAIVANPNVRAAGVLHDGVLTVRLEAREGVWRPEADDGLGIVVQAFAEAGGTLQIPGPLIRVPAGTEVRATVRNGLDSTLTVRGLHDRTADGRPGDTLRVAPGETREVRFRLAVPGTFFYAARSTTILGPGEAALEGIDSQLTGAIVVDPAGAAGASPAPDRVMVITTWSRLPEAAPGSAWGEALAINGKAWPHTERVTATVGDTVRWRVVNPSARPHPMHLHGFYFQVESRGTMARDTVYAPALQRPAVTEFMVPGSTMTMRWVPERAGNWVFHCHFAEHVAHHARLYAAHEGAEARTAPAAHAAHGGGHAMSGIVLGVHVLPRPGAVEEEPAGARRALRLLVQSRPGRYGAAPGLGYVLQEGAEPAPDSIVIPGAPLLLVRGEPVRITVVNRLREATAVHWHGIELESFPDGVPGWSGTPGRLMPPIAPGDSFVAEFTPPRAGTFMYHAHMDEGRQIGSGLYAPLLVVERGQRLDPATDRILLFSQAGPGKSRGAPDLQSPMLLNGRPASDTITLRADAAQRLRLIYIRANGAARIRLRGAVAPDTATSTWRPLAKDGADLPPAQQRPRPAVTLMGVGEITDVEVTPTAGLYVLELGTPAGIVARVPVRVQ